MANIDGTASGETLTGTSDVDLIRGFGGDDILDGGEGADRLEGGTGSDTYFIDNPADVIIELLGEGFDAAYVSTDYALAAGVELEWLSTINNAATQAINLTGNEIVNILLGNNGVNVLNGGAGADIMAGFGGDDTYFVDNVGDRIDESAGNGFDAVYVTTSYALGTGAEVEWLSTANNGGSETINLTGNEFVNYLLGNNGANVLNGGSGGDIMAGFGGDDAYFVDDVADRIDEAAGNGFDAVYVTTSFGLAAGTEVEWLSAFDNGGTQAINLTGNELANFVLGNAGANVLNGGGGADIMAGFGGDDTYFIDNIGDRVDEAAGNGFDAVYVTTSYALAAGAEIEWLAVTNNGGSDAINLTGNEFANFVLGNAGANVLNGRGGADIMAGYGGADTFVFTDALGAGNVDTIGDFVSGTDKIQLGGATGEPFAALATGSLRTGTLVIGSAALDADDYLIYNSITGALLYDADGIGAGAAVQFATLSTGLSLTAADFFVSGAANTAPSITSGATASVAENSATSTIVYQLAATDADGDRLTYALSGTDAALLSIDANGAVRLLASPDFEAKSSYTFNVLASDSGATTTRAVTLGITDVNENLPTTTRINETAAANDSIAAAQTIDRGTFNIADNPNLPNDDLPSATIVGNLPNSSDHDFFAITLQAGEKLVLDVDFSGGNLDSFLHVYGPGGVEIGTNDDQGGLDPGSAAHPTYGHNTDSTYSFRAPTAGTYYFSIESFQDAQNPTFGSYEINVSIGPPATSEQLLLEDADALISGAFWTHTDLSYGFPTAASLYPQDFLEVSADPTDPTDEVPVFQAFSAGQIAATQALLQMVSNVSVLTFHRNTGTGNYLTPGSAANADLRYAESNEAEVAYAYYPTNDGSDDVGGSAWFNHVDFNNPIRGNYAWMGILHETGHALGLKHGHEPPAISTDHDTVEYSVMTYRSYVGAPVEGDEAGYSNEMFGYPTTLMMLDIAALQKIYGANYEYNKGDSVYSWSSSSGEMSINGVGQGAPGNGTPSSNRVFMTIWDGGGNDTYDLSNYNNATTIDLRPGEWTTTSNTQRANLGDGHTARGNVANALLFEGNTDSAIENARGGAGADTLIANQVANKFTGNGGADTFKWMATGDAGIGAKADTVLDFVRNTDKIDFSNLDANPATAGHDPFSFIATSAFHNVAGEVRYELQAGTAHIFADVDGNGTADMEIILTNVSILQASDFNF